MLIWQPFRNGWAVWSTVVDAFVAEGIQTPEGVADYILNGEEYYYLRDSMGNLRYEKNLRTGLMEPMIATCQYKSRTGIVDYYTRLLGDVKESRIHMLTEQGWVEEVTPVEQVRENLEKSFAHAIQEWEAGRIYPDDKAKEELRRGWIEEAERVKREGVLTISGITFKITGEGITPTGEVVKGPEIW